MSSRGLSAPLKNSPVSDVLRQPLFDQLLDEKLLQFDERELQFDLLSQLAPASTWRNKPMQENDIEAFY